MSRSVMIRGAGDSSSKTRAAPVPFSVIFVAVSLRVWPGPTARTTLDMPSRTSTRISSSRLRPSLQTGAAWRSLVPFGASLSHAWRCVGGSSPTYRIPALMSDPTNGGHKIRRRINRRAIWLVATIAAAAAVVGLTGCDLGPKTNLDQGQQLFTQKCGSCHTLTGAGTNGDIGPNLDFAFKQSRANGMDGD